MSEIEPPRADTESREQIDIESTSKTPAPNSKISPEGQVEKPVGIEADRKETGCGRKIKVPLPCCILGMVCFFGAVIIAVLVSVMNFSSSESSVAINSNDFGLMNEKP